MQSKLVVATMGLIIQTGFIAPTVCAGELSDALLNGKPTLNLRYRYEQVDQTGIANTADASTIRTRLGYTTGELSGFSAFIEMEDTHKVFTADYTTPGAGPVATDLGPKEPGHPVVADPIGTELNQSFLQYKRGDSITKFGRQRIIRGNARFVGNVGWRQNEQTFDAFSYQNKSIENLDFFVAYISNRNTITLTDIDMDTALFDISYSGIPGGKLSAYFYDVEVDVSNGPFWEIAGFRYDGKAGVFKYTLEYATQEQSSGAEPDYSLLELSYKNDVLTPTFGIETLGSDQVQTATGTAQAGFATPLATLHKFNGWADVFLATPAVGLQDTYLKLATKAAGIKLALVFHDFEADTGSLDYGDEIDLLAVKALSKQFKVGFKYASYSAGDAATGRADVDKAWLWAEFGF